MAKLPLRRKSEDITTPEQESKGMKVVRVENEFKGLGEPDFIEITYKLITCNMPKCGKEFYSECDNTPTQIPYKRRCPKCEIKVSNSPEYWQTKSPYQRAPKRFSYE